MERRISWKEQVDLQGVTMDFLNSFGCCNQSTKVYHHLLFSLCIHFASCNPEAHVHGRDKALSFPLARNHLVPPWSWDPGSDKLPPSSGRKSSRSPLWLPVRKMGRSPPRSSPTDVPPPWQSTKNLWNSKGGACTQTPAISEGSKRIWLSPRYWAPTERDNSAFPFLIQPAGDGRFRTFSHALSLRNFLWLLTSTGGWKRNQVVWDLQRGFVWKLLQFAGQTLVAFCKYCHHWPAKVVHLNLCEPLSCQQRSCFQSASMAFFFFSGFARFQAETVNSTITCDHAQPWV